MLEANFWQDKLKSQKIIKEKKLFEDLVSSYNESNNQLQDLNDLNELALQENNTDIQNEVGQNISKLRLLVKKNEIKCFLSKEADPLDTYIEIHAGAGGTESQDWANMLKRMYLKFLFAKVPTVLIEPKCIKKDPSPSMQIVLPFFSKENPRATDDV